jgi:hypothetical protein
VERLFQEGSTVAHYEAAKSEMACKYVAGLSSFTFLWLAYEATVRLTRPDVLRKLLREEKFGGRGRRLFEEYAGEFPEISGATRIARLAEGLCERGNLFDERLKAIRAKYAKRDMVFSAELVREFRNFIVHGEDKVPDHEAWHYGRTRGEATARVRRFYAIGRLILVLIQSFACAGLCGEGKEIEYGEDDTGLGSLRGNSKLLLAGLHLLDGWLARSGCGGFAGVFRRSASCAIGQVQSRA